MDQPLSDVTTLLGQLTDGDEHAANLLFPIVYDDLRKRAARLLSNERADHTLQPTALVNEAYARLAREDELSPRDRQHFLGIAASAMRRILVDHARAKKATKRGGGRPTALIDDVVVALEDRCISLVALHDALEELATAEPRRARVVELRFFGGFTLDEVAALLDVSPRTVDSDWRLARAWLLRELRDLRNESVR